MITLRPYQSKLMQDCFDAWNNGSRNNILVSPTGSGKTVLMAEISRQMQREGVAIAHRSELVGQISIALARVGLYHRIIASDTTIKFCINKHINELGRSYINNSAPFSVASVDTVMARKDTIARQMAQMKMWSIDECHHVLPSNKWGAVTEMMPGALGVGYTATPIRADRKSLAREQGGCFDVMCVGPSMRQLIDQGSLADYRVFVPPASIDRDQIKIGSTGDFQRTSMTEAMHKSRIVGDIVSHYIRLAKGKRGITFTADVAHAMEVAGQFMDAGVPAAAVSGKTSDTDRDRFIQAFIAGDILQLVNVDLFGEGFDVPACEVVSFGRPTESYGLFVQQFGRALRTADGKTHGIVIDHVGNVTRHGLPDAPRNWQLVLPETRGKRVKVEDDDVVPVRVCASCMGAYEAVLKVCPYCGNEVVPAGRGSPEQVDGDLTELDAATLAQLRGEADHIMQDSPITIRNPRDAAMASNWDKRREAQAELREAISYWAGMWRDRGDADSAIYRRFYHVFGVDIASAQTLSTPDAWALQKKVSERIEQP